jgi:hypothetical protein
LADSGIPGAQYRIIAILDALAQYIGLKPTRQCVKRIGNDYPAREQAKNNAIHTTQKRELFNMPPKGA